MNALLLHLLFGITLLLTLALIGVVILRRRSAAVRHSVLVAAMFGVLLVPLLLPMLPHWSLAVVEIEAAKEPVTERSAVAVQPVATIDIPSMNIPRVYDELPMFEIENLQSSFVLPTETEHSASVVESLSVAALLYGNAHTFLLALWTLVSCLMFLRLVLSIRTAMRIIAKTHALDEPLLATITQRLGITKPIALQQSEIGIVPFAFGIRKPVIVLPESANRWTVEERRAVLTHELGHIARRDVFWQWLVEFCCAIYWFHPLVWLTAWRLRVEREIACDDLVVLAGEEPPMYASVLLRLAKSLKNTASRQRVLGCTVAMARRHEVKRRIRSILNPDVLRKPLGRIGVMILLFVAAVGIAFAAMLSPTKVPEPPKSDSEIEQEKKLAIAVMPNTPKISICGNVFMPDGSPASEGFWHVDVFSVAYVFTQNFSSAEGKLPPDRNHCGFSTSQTTGNVKREDGTFEEVGHVLPGANVAVTIYPVNFDEKVRTNPKKQFLSKPMAVVARENMEPLNITLEEGILLRGKIMYANGTPAAARGLTLIQQVEPVLGADIPQMKEGFRSSRWCQANESGEFEIYLLPGDYTIADKYLIQTFTIAKTDTEKRLDLTLPTPIFVELDNEDGSPVGIGQYCMYLPTRNGLFSSYSKEGGSFVLEPVTENCLLYLSDSGRKHGSVETITPEMVGKTMRFTLKPSGNAVVTLVDLAGKPVTGEQVRLSLLHRDPISKATCELGMSDAVTGSDGKAVLPVFPGKVPAVLTLPGSFEQPIPTGGKAILDKIEQELDLAPGETFDFGTIKLTKVFSSQEAATKFNEPQTSEGGHKEPVTQSPGEIAGFDYMLDYIELLKKRVEVANAKFEEADAAYHSGSGPASRQAESRIALATAEIALYRQTGDYKNLLAALERKREAAEHLLLAFKAAYESGSVSHTQCAEAELELAEAEYELKKTQKALDEIMHRVDSRRPVLAEVMEVPDQNKMPLLVQGKTFAQWREVFQTELDTKFRTEAFRAMALFGANGYGKEATEAILEAVKGVSFESLREVNFNHLPPHFTNGGNPIEEMKFTAINAFISKDMRITPTDFVPILVEKLSNEGTNEQLFAFLVLNNTQRFAESELYSLCYEKFMQWDINDLKAHARDKSPSGSPFVLFWVQYHSKNGEMVIKYLRETIQKNDEFRFQFYFANFQPLEFDEQGRIVVGDQHGYGPPLKLSPPVADGPTTSTTTIGKTTNTSVILHPPQLTVFGRNLLALLREEGVKSDNAAIRTTSQQVVDALTQIEALGEE